MAPVPTPTAAQNASRRKVVAMVLGLIASGGALTGLNALRDREEGNRLTAYQDIGGTWTICGGITANVQPGEVKTEPQCHALNSAEAKKVLAEVDGGFVRRQPDARRVAFADFAYNVGKGAFMGSTARRLINRGEIVAGCNELQRWVYVNGRVVAWQVERRAIERDLCMDGVQP